MVAAERDPSFEVTVDVAVGTVGAGGAVWEFDLDERTLWLLLNGYDDIAVTLREAESIAAYETSRPYWLPSLRKGHAAVPRAHTAQETT
ncbi:hypothetical protein [Streptomyces broussonetiae]